VWVRSTDQNQVIDDDVSGADDAVAADDTASTPHVVPDADREGCFELVAAQLPISGVGRCQQLDVRSDLAVLPDRDRSSQT